MPLVIFCDKSADTAPDRDKSVIKRKADRDFLQKIPFLFLNKKCFFKAKGPYSINALFAFYSVDRIIKGKVSFQLPCQLLPFISENLCSCRFGNCI
jgi:hypothetical protein